MKSQVVVVKDVDDRHHIVKVCHTRGTTVFVTSEKVYHLLKSGKSELFPIGFPGDRVFVYDGGDPEVNAAKLQPWSST